MNDRISALLACVNKGRCACPPMDPTCVSVGFVNRFEARDDVRMEVCRDHVCRTLYPSDGSWEVEEKVTFALPFDRSFVDLWGEIGDEPPEIRLWAGKRRLRFDGSAYGRAVSPRKALDKKQGGR